MSSVRNGRQGTDATAVQPSQRKRRKKRKAPCTDEPSVSDGTTDDVKSTEGRAAKRSRLIARSKAEAGNPMQSPPIALKSPRRRGAARPTSHRRRTVCEKLTPNTDCVGDPGWYQPDLNSTQDHDRRHGGGSFARASRRTLFSVIASKSDGPGPCSYQREISTPARRNTHRSSRSTSKKKPNVPLFDKKPKSTRRRKRLMKAPSAFKVPQVISKSITEVVTEDASGSKVVTDEASESKAESTADCVAEVSLLHLAKNGFDSGTKEDACQKVTKNDDAVSNQVSGIALSGVERDDREILHATEGSVPQGRTDDINPGKEAPVSMFSKTDARKKVGSPRGTVCSPARKSTVRETDSDNDAQALAGQQIVPRESDLQAEPREQGTCPEFVVRDMMLPAASRPQGAPAKLVPVENTHQKGSFARADSPQASVEWCSPESTPEVPRRASKEDKENEFFSVPLRSDAKLRSDVGSNMLLSHHMELTSSPRVWSPDSKLLVSTPSGMRVRRNLTDSENNSKNCLPMHQSAQANTSFVPLTLKEILGTPGATRVEKTRAPMSENVLSFESSAGGKSAKQKDNEKTRSRPVLGDITNGDNNTKDTSGFLAELWESRHEDASFCGGLTLEALSRQKGALTSQVSANSPLVDKSHSLPDRSLVSQVSANSPLAYKSHSFPDRSFVFCDQENALPASVRVPQKSMISETRGTAHHLREPEAADSHSSAEPETSQRLGDSSSASVHMAERVYLSEVSPECASDNISVQTRPSSNVRSPVVSESENASQTTRKRSSVARDSHTSSPRECYESANETKSERQPTTHRRSRESLWQVFHQRSDLARRFTMPAASRRTDNEAADDFRGEAADDFRGGAADAFRGEARVRHLHRRATMPNMRLHERFVIQLRIVFAFVVWLVMALIWLRWLVN